MTKPRKGPLMPGEPVQLTDPKGRSHLITLRAGASFHTHRGTLSHDDIIGGPDGNVVRSLGGTPYVVFRPRLADFTLAMKRGAAVVYPKDAAQIVAFADVFPGARVLEAGAGSGALSCWLLRAVGEQGSLVSFERRPDFAEIARRNVEQFFGGAPPAWQLVTGEFSPEGLADFDRVILDMLAPWDCVEAVASVLAPGGLACCYVATTTQLSRTVETLRAHGGWLPGWSPRPAGAGRPRGHRKKITHKIIDPNGPACYAYPAGVGFPRAGGVDANALRCCCDVVVVSRAAKRRRYGAGRLGKARE